MFKGIGGDAQQWSPLLLCGIRELKPLQSSDWTGPSRTIRGLYEIDWSLCKSVSQTLTSEKNVSFAL